MNNHTHKKDIPESVLRHLEMIQGVIDRMARNSFLLKGWAVTLLAATMWLSVRMPDAMIPFAATAIFLIATFWGLDGYYLRQERLFRCLYDGVRKKDDTDFAMHDPGCSAKVPTWLQTCVSLAQFNTLLMFYGALAILSCLLMLVMYAQS